jgi:hypothetical protein
MTSYCGEKYPEFRKYIEFHNYQIKFIEEQIRGINERVRSNNLINIDETSKQ